MTMMITEVYDAFKSAGADDDKARKAAEAIAGFQSVVTDLKADMLVLKWMVAANLTFSITLMVRTFF